MNHDNIIQQKYGCQLFCQYLTIYKQPGVDKMLPGIYSIFRYNFLCEKKKKLIVSLTE